MAVGHHCDAAGDDRHLLRIQVDAADRWSGGLGADDLPAGRALSAADRKLQLGRDTGVGGVRLAWIFIIHPIRAANGDLSRCHLSISRTRMTWERM